MTKNPWRSKDNTDRGEKIEIRRSILPELNTTPKVLDCFAGEGKIYRECYQGMQYIGLDKKGINDGRTIIKVDNIKYLRSAELKRFNVFDLDAYGSPWYQFLIILKRRPVLTDERIAIFLTDGLQFKAAVEGDLPHGLKPYCGIPQQMRIPCLARHLDYIRSLIVVNASRKAGLEITKALIGQNCRKNMTYIGLLLASKKT